MLKSFIFVIGLMGIVKTSMALRGYYWDGPRVTGVALVRPPEWQDFAENKGEGALYFSGKSAKVEVYLIKNHWYVEPNEATPGWHSGSAVSIIGKDSPGKKINLL